MTRLYQSFRNLVCSLLPLHICAGTKPNDSAEASGGVFQIRPHKEFTPHRGRDRLLSLRFLSELTTEDSGQCLSSDSSSGAEPRNAYEFMQKRKQAAGDPTMKRWNAAIRLANYASVESSLCVRLDTRVQFFLSHP